MAFNKNNYKLKYYKQFKNLRHEIVRLEIHEKSGAELVAKEIYALSGVQLEVDGKSEVIDTPIIKTSLRFTLIDCIDITDTDQYKAGNWQEFYTPDATKYLVEVYTSRPGDSTIRARWRGFITPDSWEESLGYRGDITITARDGIGTLNEIPFRAYDDGSGMCQVRRIFERAFEVANIAMYTWIGESSSTFDNELQTRAGDNIFDLYMNITAFEDKTWYEVMEDLLDSLGLVMRFADPDMITIVPLRYLPHLNRGDIEPLSDLAIGVEFYGGTKIMDPSYKEIIESIDFGFEADRSFDASENDTIFRNDETPTYLCQHNYWHNKHNWGTMQFPVQVHSSMDYGDDGKWETDGYPVFLDTSRYPIDASALEKEGEDLTRYLFAAVNSFDESPRRANFKKKVSQTACKIRLEFSPYPGTIYSGRQVNDWGGMADGELSIIDTYSLEQLDYAIWYQNEVGASTIYKYWDGEEWVDSWKYHSVKWEEGSTPSSIEVNVTNCPGVDNNGYIVFSLVGATFIGHSRYLFDQSEHYRGLFLRIKSISFESHVKQNIESHKTTTRNMLNTACNVRLNREPVFGMLPRAASMLFRESYKYAFFVKDSRGDFIQAPFDWRWNRASNGEPFPAIIAKQILCYHAASESILEGDFAPVNPADATSFAGIYKYKGVPYIIQGGTFDFKEGRFLSTSLRSFHLYDDIFNN